MSDESMIGLTEELCSSGVEVEFERTRKGEVSPEKSSRNGVSRRRVNDQYGEDRFGGCCKDIEDVFATIDKFGVS